MKFPHAALAALGLMASVLPCHAQESGFKGFLKRTAGAVMGQPDGTSGAPNGTVSYGTTSTDGPVYRPIAPASGGSFEGIFKGYAGASNVQHYPRVALTFLTYGAAEACWRTRAVIWTSATAHAEETFDLCNGALTMKDDLGRTTQQADPTLSLTRVIDARQYMATNRFVTVVDERTTGPNPARVPFRLNVAQNDGGAFMRQYRAIVARAMVVSGYNGGDLGQLMWVGGFDPAGNRDRHVD
ncbi:hypothetical protein [Luteibacter sp. UNCMF366Tsu5.1]|uniref:hypothetical protein n=1 Tax=Luteibacter sp. UNCMF366Tsu5.1 TaxID=1502758 RepID=UPI000908A9DC|nr:hypothetical protein [Luteibacter sp. UNCMF366Tsu5.1]SFW74463.1 hypothetical protein SAMN02800691_3435 [Luteibacter sp. UNCMF366Tsu5.1]